MSARRITLLLLLGVAIGLLLYWGNRPPEIAPSVAEPDSATVTSPTAPNKDATGTTEGQAEPVRIGQPATRPLAPINHPDPAMRSPLADDLLARDGSAEADIQIVLTLCDQFLEKCGGMPVGTNREIVNALTGNNPARLAFIPRDHPAINGAGEIVDRWGTPFFFHNVARDLIGIRSAGPDLEMFTSDDLLQQSPRLEAVGRGGF